MMLEGGHDVPPSVSDEHVHRAAVGGHQVDPIVSPPVPGSQMLLRADLEQQRSLSLTLSPSRSLTGIPSLRGKASFLD